MAAGTTRRFACAESQLFTDAETGCQLASLEGLTGWEFPGKDGLEQAIVNAIGQRDSRYLALQCGCGAHFGEGSWRGWKLSGVSDQLSVPDPEFPRAILRLS